MTIMEEIMDYPVFKDIQAKLQAAADSLLDQRPCNPIGVELLRDDLQAKYDMLYEAGMIPTRPTVAVKSFDPQSGVVTFDINFPMTTWEALLQYAEDDTENSAIDSPLDKP